MDRFLGFLTLLAAYVAVGGLTGWILDDVMGLVPIPEDGPIADYVALIVLWPFFVIKFLAIGLWAVLYSGFTLLV